MRDAWGAWIDVADQRSRVLFAARARRRGVPAAHLQALLDGGERADWAVGSLSDTPAPSESLLRACAVKACVMTAGANGHRVWEPEQGWCSEPAPAVAKVLDSTGAGDAFLAGLLAGLRAGQSARDAARSGALSAGACIAHVGAWPVA